MMSTVMTERSIFQDVRQFSHKNANVKLKTKSIQWEKTLVPTTS